MTVYQHTHVMGWIHNELEDCTSYHLPQVLRGCQGRKTWNQSIVSKKGLIEFGRDIRRGDVRVGGEIDNRTTIKVSQIPFHMGSIGLGLGPFTAGIDTVERGIKIGKRSEETL